MWSVVPADLLGPFLDSPPCGLSCGFVLKEGDGQPIARRGIDEVIRAVDAGHGGGGLQHPVPIVRRHRFPNSHPRDHALPFVRSPRFQDEPTTDDGALVLSDSAVNETFLAKDLQPYINLGNSGKPFVKHNPDARMDKVVRHYAQTEIGIISAAGKPAVYSIGTQLTTVCIRRGLAAQLAFSGN